MREELRARDEPQIPTLVGRRVALEPVVGVNLEFARGLLADPAISARFRFANVMPGPPEIDRVLSERVTSQAVLRRRSNGDFLGLAQLTNANYRHGTANLSMVVHPTFQRRPWVLEGGALFIEYVFSSFPLRKLYAEAVAFNLEQFSSVTNLLFSLEGRLVEHEWHYGRYWDVSILSLTRERWTSSRVRSLALRKDPSDV